VAQRGEIKRVNESKAATKARVVEKLSSTRERAINASKRDRESILSGKGKVNQKPKKRDLAPNSGCTIAGEFLGRYGHPLIQCRLEYG
jgi:hypothetical protein